MNGPLFFHVGLPSLLTFFSLCFAAQADEVGASLQKKILEKIRVKHIALTCSEWRAWGAETPRVVERMLENPERESDRLKLIEGLGCFPDEAARQKLKEIATNATVGLQRRVAIESITRAGSDEETVQWVRSFLEHEDPQTRFSAAQSLIQSNIPETRAWVDEYINQEKESWIRKKLLVRLEKGVLQTGKNEDPEKVSGGGLPEGRPILAPALKTQKAPSILEASSGSGAKAGAHSAALWAQLKRDWAGDWQGAWIQLRANGAEKHRWESSPVHLRLTFGAEVGSSPKAELSMNGQPLQEMGEVLLSPQEISIARPAGSVAGGASGAPAARDYGSWTGLLERETPQVQILELKPSPGMRRKDGYRPSRVILFREGAPEWGGRAQKK
jgi:hypothetical protein